MVMFEKTKTNARFKNPLMGFEEDRQDIEYRRDPLTGQWTRLNIMRAERAKQKPPAEQKDRARSTRDGCFFCPENIQDSTPMFPPEISGEGRITRGESVVFPNLYPFAQYHAVAVITRDHFQNIEEFTPQQVADTLHASIDYLRRVHEVDPDARYPTVNWNHLPPSGASILHPHMQITMDARPTWMQDTLLRATREKPGVWQELVDAERGGERYVGQTGGIEWLTSFAPIGNHEVNALFTGSSAVTRLSDEEIRDFARGVTRVLRGYAADGVESFNLTFYSAPVEGLDGYMLNAKMISRPSLKPYYTSDQGFMESLHREVIIEGLPEEVAGMLRRYW